MRVAVIDPAPPKRDYLLGRLRAAGAHVTGVTPVRGASGLAACDEALVHPFLPPADLARALTRRGRVDGVVCYHQAATHAANQVAHHLGLPPLWDDPTADLTDKQVLERLWRAAGLPVPVSFTRDEDARFPVVVKPSSLQGSIGVKACHDLAELRAWRRELAALRVPFSVDGVEYEMTELYGQRRDVLVQELVVGDDGDVSQFTAELFVQDGEVRYLGSFEKKALGGSRFFDETVFVFPSFHDLRRHEELFVEATRALGVRNGFCHLELKIRGGEAVLLELNPRLVGEPAGRMLEDELGVAVADATLAAAIGRRPRAPLAARRGVWTGFACVIVASERCGGRFDRLAVPRLDGVDVEVHPYFERGETVPPAVHWGGTSVADLHFRAQGREAAARAFDELLAGTEVRFMRGAGEAA